MMINKNLINSLFVQLLIIAGITSASPAKFPQDLNDENMKIIFEVHAPWNILDGKAKEISGKISMPSDENPNGLLADVAVQNISYKAGISVAGRLVAGWLRLNSPTPAKFVISKSVLNCAAETNSCSGSVDGKLTIWGKDYTIDIPVETKSAKNGTVLTGVKEIKWGDYGFGDPESTISSLKPIIDLNFSVEIPTAN